MPRERRDAMSTAETTTGGPTDPTDKTTDKPTGKPTDEPADKPAGGRGAGERRPGGQLAGHGGHSGGIAVLAERAALPVAWVVLIIIYTITSPGLFLTWSNI